VSSVENHPEKKAVCMGRSVLDLIGKYAIARVSSGSTPTWVGVESCWERRMWANPGGKP